MIEYLILKVKILINQLSQVHHLGVGKKILSFRKLSKGNLRGKNHRKLLSVNHNNLATLGRFFPIRDRRQISLQCKH